MRMVTQRNRKLLTGQALTSCCLRGVLATLPVIGSI